MTQALGQRVDHLRGRRREDLHGGLDLLARGGVGLGDRGQDGGSGRGDQVVHDRVAIAAGVGLRVSQHTDVTTVPKIDGRDAGLSAPPGMAS